MGAKPRELAIYGAEILCTSGMHIAQIICAYRRVGSSRKLEYENLHST